MSMLQLENVEFPKDKDKNGVEVVATMDTFLAPLVERLALAHPEWQFKSHHCRKYYGSGSGDAEFSMLVERVQVVDKYEPLGLLGTDYVSSGRRFWVSNHRTEKMRERGSGMKTIHLDKACKHVEKYFGRMNHDEKLAQASSNVNDAIYRVFNEATYKMRNVWNSVDEESMHFVVDNLEAFKNYMQSNLATATQLAQIDRLPELVAEQEGMNKLRECVAKNEHTLVLLEGMNYIVKHAGRVEIKTSEELPDSVRRGLGMLKLVEVGNAITNIGIRVDENTFALLPNNVI